MRSRKEIEHDRIHTMAGNLNDNQILILEVLLDIRDTIHAKGEQDG